MLQGSRTAKWLFKESLSRARNVLNGNMKPLEALGENPKVLFDFSNPEHLKQWTVRSDRMWGGKSLAMFDKSKSNPNIAVFKGRLSSWIPTGIQRSGYAALRTQPMWINLNQYDHFALKVKTDGTRFLFNVKADVIHNDELHQVAVAVPPNKWVEVVIPYSIFMRTFMGRPAQIPTWGLTAKSIENFSILIDKRDGPFSIELEYIKVFKPEENDKNKSIRTRQSFCNPITEAPEEFPPEAFDEASDLLKIEEMERELRATNPKSGLFARVFSMFGESESKPQTPQQQAEPTPEELQAQQEQPNTIINNEEMNNTNNNETTTNEGQSGNENSNERK